MAHLPNRVDRASWTIAFVLAAAAGCGRSKTNAPIPRAVANAVAAEASCPLHIESAEIQVAETPGGIELTVTAAAERVEELRRRARDAAALYGPGAHKGLGHHGVHLGAQRLRLTELPPLNATVEDVARGARIDLEAWRCKRRSSGGAFASGSSRFAQHLAIEEPARPPACDAHGRFGSITEA